MKKLFVLLLILLINLATVPSVTAATLTVVGWNYYLPPSSGTILKMNYCLQDAGGNNVSPDLFVWSLSGSTTGKWIIAPGVIGIDSTATGTFSVNVAGATSKTVYYYGKEYYDFDYKSSTALPADGTEINGNKYCAGATANHIYTAPYGGIQTASMAGYNIVFSTKVMAKSSGDLGAGIAVTDGVIWLLTLSLVDCGGSQYYIQVNHSKVDLTPTSFSNMLFNYGSWTKLTVSMNVKNQMFSLWIDNILVAEDFMLPTSTNNNFGNILVRSNIDELNVCVGTELSLPIIITPSKNLLYTPTAGNNSSVLFKATSYGGLEISSVKWSIGMPYQGVSIGGNDGILIATSLAVPGNIIVNAVDTATNIATIYSYALKTISYSFDGNPVGDNPPGWYAGMVMQEMGNRYVRGTTEAPAIYNINNTVNLRGKSVMECDVRNVGAVSSSINLISFDNAQGAIKTWIVKNNDSYSYKVGEAYNLPFIGMNDGWNRLRIEFDTNTKKYTAFMNDALVGMSDISYDLNEALIGQIVFECDIDNFTLFTGGYKSPVAYGLFPTNIGVGKTPVAHHSYYSQTGETENGTETKWYICDKNGTNETEINAAGFPLTEDDSGKYIKISITPAAGTHVGQSVFSTPVKILADMTLDFGVLDIRVNGVSLDTSDDLKDGANTVSATITASSTLVEPMGVVCAIAYYENNKLVAIKYLDKMLNANDQLDVWLTMNATPAVNRKAKVVVWKPREIAPIIGAVVI